jgi:hypothetical protein
MHLLQTMFFIRSEWRRVNSNSNKISTNNNNKHYGVRLQKMAELFGTSVGWIQKV